MLPKSFFWRLFLGWLALLAGALGAVGFIARDRLEALQYESHKQRLLQESRLVYALLRDDLLAGRTGELAQTLARLGEATGSRLTVIDADGRVLADNTADPERLENHRLRPEIVGAAARGAGEALRWSRTLGDELLYLATRNEEPGGRFTYVRLALPVSRLKAGLSGFDAALNMALAVVFVLGALAGWLAARRLAAPIVELARFGEGLARGEHGGRVYAGHAGEPGALAQALNQIAEGLAAASSRALREHEELRAILEGMSDGIVATDAQQQVLIMNRAASALLDLPTPPEPGKPLWAWLRQEALLKAADEALRSARHQATQWTCPRGRHIQAALLPLKRPPEPDGLVIVLRDITKEVQFQELRKEFVANVSHELRTPLTVIKGYIETLAGGALRDEVKGPEQLAILARRVDQLSNLVRDLLELSRLEGHPGLPGQAAVNVQASIAAVADLMQPAARKKAQTLKTQAAEGLPLLIGNPEYIERALLNLVDNAIKYTPDGGAITISAERAGEQAVISVTDTGIGIPEKDLPRIFERFYRVDKSRSREMGGTGLGLAIVKHIALAHDGTVEVTSKPGVGSTFRLKLPLRPSGAR